MLVDIGSFRERPLDPAALENIRKILAFFEENQRDVIFRPVYDREGKGRGREPGSFELVLEHLGQLGDLLKENPCSVFIFQGFLVGSWGEMHDSAYLSEDCLKKMWEQLKPALSKNIYGAVRTPSQWRTLVSEEEFRKGSFPRLGLFDDGIFGSKTHLGTFGTMTREAAGWKKAWLREEELTFLKVLGKKLPIGGEAVRPESAGVSGCGRERVVAELEKLNLTYLNRAYDRRLLELWEMESFSDSGIWRKKSLLDYVGAHLGYRFVLQNVEWEKGFGSRRLRFLLEIQNCGFGGFSGSRAFSDFEIRGEERDDPHTGIFQPGPEGRRKVWKFGLSRRQQNFFWSFGGKKTEKSSGLQMKKAQTACFSAACASVKNNVQESVKVPTGMVSLVS